MKEEVAVLKICIDRRFLLWQLKEIVSCVLLQLTSTGPPKLRKINLTQCILFSIATVASRVQDNLQCLVIQFAMFTKKSKNS